MAETDMISAYAELLAAKLGFDGALSRRVRREVEDHLLEAAAAATTGDIRDAERLAIANFGDPHLIAVQFAAASLVKKIRNVGVAAILIIAGVFMMMKARVAWYGVTQWSLGEDVRALSGIIGSIDAYAFWLSVALGLAAFVYIGSGDIPTALDTAYRRRLRRIFLLGIATTSALGISVVSDAVLTSIRLRGAEFCAASLIPLFSMAIEIACAAILIFLIRSTLVRMESTADLLNS